LADGGTQRCIGSMGWLRSLGQSSPPAAATLQTGTYLHTLLFGAERDFSVEGDWHETLGSRGLGRYPLMQRSR